MDEDIQGADDLTDQLLNIIAEKAEEESLVIAVVCYVLWVKLTNVLITAGWEKDELIDELKEPIQ
jgi:hypothetical protein